MKLLRGILLLGVCFMPAHAGQDLRVGVIQREPVALSQQAGMFERFAAEILLAIAREQDWRLRFEGGSQQELLLKLERQQIDLLINLAYTQESRKRYLFNQQFLIIDWGEISTLKKSSIASLTDLDGRRIGVVKKSPYYRRLKKLLNRFHLEPELVTYRSFDDIASAIGKLEVDAGVFSREFMLKEAKDRGIRSVPVIFSPREIRYVVAGEHLTEVMTAIDSSLHKSKQSGSSYYYKIFDTWFPLDRGYRPPEYLWWLVVVLGALVVGFFLGRGVRRR